MNPLELPPPPPMPPSPSVPPPPPGRRRRVGVAVMLVLLGLFLLFILVPRRTPPPGSAELPLSDFEAMLQGQRITSIVIGADELSGDALPGTQTADGRPVNHYLTKLPEGTSRDWTFNKWLLDHRGPATVRAGGVEKESLAWLIIMPLVPWVFICFFVWLVFRHSTRLQREAMSRPQPVYAVAPRTGRPVEANRPGPPAP